MWPIIAAISAGVFVTLMELPALRKGKQHKEMLIFGFLMASSLTIYMMEQLHFHPPNPLDLISAIYEWFGLVAGK